MTQVQFDYEFLPAVVLAFFAFGIFVLWFAVELFWTFGDLDDD